MIKMAQSRTRGQVEEVQEQTIAKIEGDDADLIHALNALAYLYYRWNPVHDTPDSIVKDIISLGLLPESNLEQSQAFLIEFYKKVRLENKRRLTEIYSISSLPSFKACHALVDFRPVFDMPFGSKRENYPDKYSPNLFGMTPIVIVKIRRDDGDPKDIQFQMSPRDIPSIKNALEAALIEIEKVKSKYPQIEFLEF